MTASINQITVKHFQAWGRCSKFTKANTYSSASSLTAKRFIYDFVKNAPFPVISIQVDVGSEFMLRFEEACAELVIPLYVLPPKRPQYNRGVERCNRTFREEFYARRDLLADSVGVINATLNLKSLVWGFRIFQILSLFILREKLSYSLVRFSVSIT